MNAATLPLAVLHLEWVIVFTHRGEWLVFDLLGPKGQRLPVAVLIGMN